MRYPAAFHSGISFVKPSSLRALPRTEGAGPVWWSPDGRSLLFGQDGKVKRLDLASGVPVTLCETPAAVRGFSWNEHGIILIGSSRGPIQRVSATAGKLSPVTKLDASAGELGHVFPNFLPGGRWYLYNAFGPTKAQVVLGDIEGKEPPRALFAIQGGGRFSQPIPAWIPV